MCVFVCARARTDPYIYQALAAQVTTVDPPKKARAREQESERVRERVSERENKRARAQESARARERVREKDRQRERAREGEITRHSRRRSQEFKLRSWCAKFRLMSPLRRVRRRCLSTKSFVRCLSRSVVPFRSREDTVALSSLSMSSMSFMHIFVEVAAAVFLSSEASSVSLRPDEFLATM